jgi:hypothetical protein
MSLQVVLANEALFTDRADVLTIIQVGLYMRLDVLLSPKSLATVGIRAGPLGISCRIWVLDVLVNIV